MFGNVVLDIEKAEFEEVFDAKKKQRKTKLDTDLDAKDLQEVIAEYKKVVKKHAKRDFPQDPREQLVMARDAVFRSWQNDRAKHYRRMNNIDDMLGTAVNVQAMVFGNLGDTSGTGVGFTRNPAIGDEGVLWRIPDQRAGRRRGFRCSHSGATFSSWRRSCRMSTTSYATSPRGWRSTIATSRTSSSPCRTASSTCCRRATASAPAWPRCELRFRWSRKA